LNVRSVLRTVPGRGKRGQDAFSFTAALFVKDADQLLEGPAFHVTEPLVGVGD
jgi:hypothetical protein